MFLRNQEGGHTLERRRHEYRSGVQNRSQEDGILLSFRTIQWIQCHFSKVVTNRLTAPVSAGG